MARIRSVHPGLFTDEAFAGLGSDAQVFLIGLWTESDDQGLFEWKPLTLRMRLRPTKDGPIESILEELCSANCIKMFEVNGRKYGAIRNFRKYQKPKTPNKIHPISLEMEMYVGLKSDISEIASINKPSFPPKVEKSLLMEEGGDKMEEIKGGEEVAPAPEKNLAVEIISAFDASIVSNFGLARARLAPSTLDLVTAQRWIDAGATVEACVGVISAVVKRLSTAGKSGPPGNLKYFENPIREALAAKSETMPDLSPVIEKPLKLSPELIAKLEKNRIPQAAIRRWFDDAEFLDEGKRIVVKSEFVRDWISGHFDSQLRGAFGFMPEIEAA